MKVPTIYTGKYRLTEIRETVFHPLSKILSFHREPELAHVPESIRFSKFKPNGDFTIEVDNREALALFELDSVYELVFKKVEP